MSKLEADFLLAWNVISGQELERQYRFDPGRRWAFDFAHPAAGVAVEIEGGTGRSWQPSRHKSAEGFRKDAEKYNAAAAAGWLVFRLPTGLVQNLDQLGQIRETISARVLEESRR